MTARSELIITTQFKLANPAMQIVKLVMDLIVIIVILVLAQRKMTPQVV